MQVLISKQTLHREHLNDNQFYCQMFCKHFVQILVDVDGCCVCVQPQNEYIVYLHVNF